tara:strand:+ start:636 stop:1169 length:534 start_codon:yes stop_codon:yes gene_type:complete
MAIIKPNNNTISAITALPAAISTGKVLQIQTTTKTDTFSTSSTSYTDVTGLSVSITPSSSSNKIFVMAHAAIDHGNSRTMMVQLVRGSTALHIGTAASNRPGATFFTHSDEANDNTVHYTGAFQFLDTPNTTSATTYKLQARISSNNAGHINRTSVDSDNSNNARSASGITVMEIAG